MKAASVDVVVVGGGIAGLWTLNRLRKAGFSALLFEANSLGGGQTIKSQGIIHGGMKYALMGKATRESQALSSMPARWKACFSGQGELDLSEVTFLTHQQYLWVPQGLLGKLSGWMASNALKSRVNQLDSSAFPAIFKTPAFKGDVFSLEEDVVDVPSLIRALCKPNQDVMFQVDPFEDSEWEWSLEGRLQSMTIKSLSGPIQIHAKHFVFTAGAGNHQAIRELKIPGVAMQRRPLHMVMMKTPFQYELYAHCLGLSTRPRITITTHRLQDGSLVWYMGGQLAEEGVNRSEADQIKATEAELAAIFPWLSFKEAVFSTIRVDRAEQYQATGFKPEGPYVQTNGNVTIAWPTKLAFAPELADHVLMEMTKQDLGSSWQETREIWSMPMPPLAKPIWEEAFCRHVV